MAKQNKIRKIIRRLEEEFPEIEVPPPPKTNKKITMLLYRIILSQNTSWQNAGRAFKNLSAEYSSPCDLENADLRRLEGLIRPAGLYRTKAKVLKSLARVIRNNYGGVLREVLRKPLDKARDELLDLPGVGPKTADCLLLFGDGKDVLPIDTHVERTAKRLGLVDLDENPNGVKKSLESLIPKGERGKAHLLLIDLGRRYCRARNSICERCPVHNFCPRIRLE